MKRAFFTALALLGCFGTITKADTIDFGYSFSVSPVSIPGGTGTVVFSPFLGGSASAPSGVSTFAPAVSITTGSSAQGTTGSPADLFNGLYTLTVGVTDTASGFSHDFVFNGTVEGSLTVSESTLQATFFGETTSTMQIGNNEYTVSVDPLQVSLPTPGSLADALIAAEIMVTSLLTTTDDTDDDPGMGYPINVGDPSTTPPVNDVPEPTTLVLGLLAGPAAYLLRRRNRGPQGA
jgi:hypothetical protein